MQLGMAIVTPEDPHVHITRPGFTGAWTEFGVKHHLARYLPEQVVVAPGAREYWIRLRTAVDIARERGECRTVWLPATQPYGLGVPRSSLVAA